MLLENNFTIIRKNIQKKKYDIIKKILDLNATLL